MYSIKVRFFAYLIMFLSTLVLLEIISLVGYATIHMALNGKSFSQFTNIMAKHYHKIFEKKKSTSLGNYDPLTQMQFDPFSKVSDVFTTNEFGFIGNGLDNPYTNEFPQKNNETLRVIMLGGSTMFGSGVDSNTKTISAKLEKLINDKSIKLKGKKKYVQDCFSP